LLDSPFSPVGLPPTLLFPLPASFPHSHGTQISSVLCWSSQFLNSEYSLIPPPATHSPLPSSSPASTCSRTQIRLSLIPPPPQTLIILPLPSPYFLSRLRYKRILPPNTYLLIRTMKLKISSLPPPSARDFDFSSLDRFLPAFLPFSASREASRGLRKTAPPLCALV